MNPFWKKSAINILNVITVWIDWIAVYVMVWGGTNITVEMDR